MWYLISSGNLDVKYILLGGKTYIVGRRDCDVLVTGDAAVSRQHSELSVSHPEANLSNPAKLPILLLKDLSKFGTWVNKERVSGERILKDGDAIFFGSPKSSFTVVYEPLVVTTSCLDQAAKKVVRSQLSLLGGHVINDWKTDCSLLLMTKITVTIKVICALVSQRAIVTPKYLEACVQHHQGTAEKPEPGEFLPTIAESQLDPSDVSFVSDVRRRSLFQGKTFVFLSNKQFKKMSAAVELAGGMPLLMEKAGETDLLTETGTVVMSCLDSELTATGQKWKAKVDGLLKRCGKHMIQDAEIGYAVLYCSTDKHCNPEADTDTDLPGVRSQSLSQMDVYVQDSETQSRTQPRRSPTRKAPVPGTSVASPGSSRKPEKIDTSQPARRTRQTSPVPTAVSPKCSAPLPSSKQKSPAQGSRSPRPGESDLKNEMSPVLPVKEEPRSQGSSTPRSTRKRVHVAMEEGEEPETLPSGKRIKQEPVTPKTKPVSANQELVESEASVKAEVVMDSDDEDSDFRRVGRKTSPHRSPRKQSPRKQSPKPRTSPRPSPPPSPARKGRGRKTAEEKSDNTEQEVKKQSTRTKTEPDRTGIYDEPSMSSQHKKGQRPLPGQHGVQHGDTEESSALAEASEEDRVRSVLQGDVPRGFLSTRPQVKHEVRRSEENMEELDLPSNCMAVELVSLVVRKPKASSNKTAQCPEGYTRWNGKMVKNFKKFRKVQNAGAGALPNIIGGSDLEVHEGTRSKEVDDWFRETIQAESQHAAEERRADELFSWDQGTSRKRAR